MKIANKNSLLSKIIPLLLQRHSKSSIRNSLLADNPDQFNQKQISSAIDDAIAILNDESLFMVNLLHDLPPSATVLDLGSHGGSFDYSYTQAKVISIDLDFGSDSLQQNAYRVLSDAHHIPVKSDSINVIIASHTLEHFEHVEQVLSEIRRILKKDGKLWAAIPDGYSLNDRLYRFLFQGGGHVNRFSLQPFCQAVKRYTGMHATFGKQLYSGFQYLFQPAWHDNKKAPTFIKIIACLPHLPRTLLVTAINYISRLSDNFFKTSLSSYGWELLFEFPSTDKHNGCRQNQIKWVQSFINVCAFCGNGHMEITLTPTLERKFIWQLYRCTVCGRKNVYFPSSST